MGIIFKILVCIFVVPIILICVFIYAFLGSLHSSGDHTKSQPEAPPVSTDSVLVGPSLPESEPQLSDARKEEIKLAFSGYPSWPADIHEPDYQVRKILRAYEALETGSMSLVDYCPSDGTAHILGTQSFIYTVSPYSCECESFRKSSERYYRYDAPYTRYPCKHIYLLLLSLFRGFDDEVLITEEHLMISRAEIALEHELELQKVNERLARLDVESQYPYREIMSAVLESGPVTMAKLKKLLSGIPDSEINKAVNKLVSIGSVTRTKSSNSAKAACLYSVSEQ